MQTRFRKIIIVFFATKLLNNLFKFQIFIGFRCGHHTHHLEIHTRKNYGWAGWPTVGILSTILCRKWLRSVWQVGLAAYGFLDGCVEWNWIRMWIEYYGNGFKQMFFFVLDNDLFKNFNYYFNEWKWEFFLCFEMFHFNWYHFWWGLLDFLKERERRWCY